MVGTDRCIGSAVLESRSDTYTWRPSSRDRVRTMHPEQTKRSTNEVDLPRRCDDAKSVGLRPIESGCFKVGRDSLLHPQGGIQDDSAISSCPRGRFGADVAGARLEDARDSVGITLPPSISEKEVGKLERTFRHSIKRNPRAKRADNIALDGADHKFCRHALKSSTASWKHATRYTHNLEHRSQRGENHE